MSRLMSSFELSFFPQIALVIFLVVFTAVVVWLLIPGWKDMADDRAQIPLRDEPVNHRSPRRKVHGATRTESVSEHAHRARQERP